MDTLRDNPEVIWGFLLALAVVLVLTPGVGRFARILGVVDEPGETRRVHTVPVPRLGGIALLLGIFVPALAFLSLDGAYRGILLGAAIATTVGAIDDFRGLPWWGKLAGQVAAGAVAVGFGVTVDRFTFPGFGSQELPEWAAGAATIVWVVAIMNMVNFLDGMDGLAAGVCAIAGSTFAIIGLSLGAPDAALLSAIVSGACFGFLRHNFYPARIFMGDSGALLLGFLLATVSIQGLV
ncbi:MAG TPA: MraY family glycosyltransferase, partial [Gaiellaceae bacterium]